jgi:hypothetical protein
MHSELQIQRCSGLARLRGWETVLWASDATWVIGLACYVGEGPVFVVGPVGEGPVVPLVKDSAHDWGGHRYVFADQSACTRRV